MRAARYIRIVAIFFGTGMVGMVLALPLIEPADLMLARIRLQPGTTLLGLTFLALMLYLFCWVAQQLGQDEVRSAVEEHGNKWRAGFIPAGAAVLVVAAVLGGLNLMRGGEDAQRLVQLARQQTGEGFSYNISSYSAHYSGNRSSVRGRVTAWSDDEIRELDVGWDE